MTTPEQIRARRRKIDRLRTGAPLRALELCSGCGGLSLGLQRAGLQLVAHVEKDLAAVQTYALNFRPPNDRRDAWASARDMTNCSAADLVTELGLAETAVEAFDVLAAGLPCQAYARIGRSKLRAVAGGEAEAFINDERAILYLRFLAYVAETQPLAIIVENVPDILNFGGRNVAEEICDTLEEIGYTARYTLLNASHFGVPQARDRFFLVAVAEELGFAPAFPEPTHRYELPVGYQGSRRVALKFVPEETHRFAAIRTPCHRLPDAVTARQALEDLPRITEHWTDRVAMRRRRVADRIPYRMTDNLSPYAQMMRNWPGLQPSTDVDGNVVRITPRDFPIFERMPHGADYPQAHRIAEKMLEEALTRHGVPAEARVGSDAERLRAEFVPPYDPGKFPNKWWKLHPDRPSRTLTAHMGKDTYSHIHYDSSQRRMISVREAARLQSFPDSFQFAGEMNASFRQIGNAVPPILGHMIARTLRVQIEQALVRAPTKQCQAA